MPVGLFRLPPRSRLDSHLDRGMRHRDEANHIDLVKAPFARDCREHAETQSATPLDTERQVGDVR